MINQTRNALSKASSKLDKTNASLEHTLEDLADNNRRVAIEAEVQLEISQHPGWLDEIGKLIKEDPSTKSQKSD